MYPFRSPQVLDFLLQCDAYLIGDCQALLTCSVLMKLSWVIGLTITCVSVVDLPLTLYRPANGRCHFLVMDKMSRFAVVTAMSKPCLIAFLAACTC